MQATLKRRLKSAEEQVPKPQPKSELAELFDWMTSNELERMGGILKRASRDGKVTLPRDQQDFHRLVLAAWQRRQAGERPPSGEVSAWPLILALQRRHAGYSANHKFRFDVLDVRREEMESLGQLVGTASSRCDLESAVDVITRLRFDAETMDLDLFSAMVLKGEVPPEQG